MRERTYDWNGNKTMSIMRPDLSDEGVAVAVRMLGRSDLNHEMIVTMGRDRIMCLVKEKSEYKKAIEKIRSELGRFNDPESKIHEDYYLDAIENIILDLEEAKS